MNLMCRLCGLVKPSPGSVELGDERVVELARKCNVYQLIDDNNKLLPQTLCSDCFQVLVDFGQFIDNLLRVQFELQANLEDELFLDIKVEREPVVRPVSRVRTQLNFSLKFLLPLFRAAAEDRRLVMLGRGLHSVQCPEIQKNTTRMGE